MDKDQYLAYIIIILSAYCIWEYLQKSITLPNPLGRRSSYHDSKCRSRTVVVWRLQHHRVTRCLRRI